MSAASDTPPPLRLGTERLVLTMPHPDSARSVLRYLAENKEHLARWSPPRPPGFLSEEFWRWRLEQCRTEYQDDRSLRLFIFEKNAEDGPVIGQLSFTEFVRGPLQQCFLGYNIDYRYQGRGLMSEALSAGIAHVFDRLNMHRISANYMPENERSGRVLRRLQFDVVGYARDYLFINGKWRDHVLTQLLNPKSSAPGATG